MLIAESWGEVTLASSPGAQTLFLKNLKKKIFLKEGQKKQNKHLLSEDLWKPCEPNEEKKNSGDSIS